MSVEPTTLPSRSTWKNAKPESASAPPATHVSVGCTWVTAGTERPEGGGGGVRRTGSRPARSAAPRCRPRRSLRPCTPTFPRARRWCRCTRRAPWCSGSATRCGRCGSPRRRCPTRRCRRRVPRERDEVRRARRHDVGRRRRRRLVDLDRAGGGGRRRGCPRRRSRARRRRSCRRRRARRRRTSSAVVCAICDSVAVHAVPGEVRSRRCRSRSVQVERRVHDRRGPVSVVTPPGAVMS